MTTTVFTPILGKRIRVTALDSCGAIDPDGFNLTTDGFVTLTLTSQAEAGTKIVQKNASGGLCVNERFSDSFTGFELDIDFCGVNPSLLSIMSSSADYEGYGGDIDGFTLAEGPIDKWFAFELWTGLAGNSCGETPDASGYLLLPFLAGGVLKDIKVDSESAVSFGVKTAFTKGHNAWGVGPYEVVLDAVGDPAVLPTALDELDHFLMMFSGLAVPTASSEPVSNATLITTTTTTTATTTTTTAP